MIPVGEAWTRAMQAGVADANPYDGIEAGKLNLWTHDHYHASAHGYYLEALVIFGSLTGRIHARSATTSVQASSWASPVRGEVASAGRVRPARGRGTLRRIRWCCRNQSTLYAVSKDTEAGDDSTPGGKGGSPSGLTPRWNRRRAVLTLDAPRLSAHRPPDTLPLA